jgi:hypothetical protein
LAERSRLGTVIASSTPEPEHRHAAITIQAQPAAINVDPAHLAMMMIDMQRDFLDAGRFGAFQ